jgi:hypothetical protein
MDDLTPELRAELYARLCRPPSKSTAPESLPILFFGNLLNAEVATVGINPSCREYRNPNDQE